MNQIHFCTQSCRYTLAYLARTSAFQHFIMLLCIVHAIKVVLLLDLFIFTLLLTPLCIFTADTQSKTVLLYSLVPGNL